MIIVPRGSRAGDLARSVDGWPSRPKRRTYTGDRRLRPRRRSTATRVPSTSGLFGVVSGLCGATTTSAPCCCGRDVTRTRDLFTALLAKMKAEAQNHYLIATITRMVARTCFMKDYAALRAHPARRVRTHGERRSALKTVDDG
jgi:hypothetical protein